MGGIERIPRVGFFRLLRMIRSLKPLLLATDNVYELARTPDGLPPLLSSLPADTKIVQVTGPPQLSRSLQVLAEKHGLPYPSRIMPLEEAEVAARLAATGIGAEVVALENETKIQVCRSVSLGPGGSSQSRYRRGVHVSILTMTRRIEHILKSAGVDFDLFTEESDFGLERVEFTVYVPRPKLAGLIKPGHGRSIQVKVIPVYRNQIEFIPLKLSATQERTPEQKLIVGIDPGTTCGLTAITLAGAPLCLQSQKGMSRGDVVRILMNLGDPILIAADVSPPPEFVEKLAKEFEATVYRPEALLTAMEKQEVARDYVEKWKMDMADSHCRDALVAAIKAFNHYRSKFDSVEGELEARNLGLHAEEVKALVVKGYSIPRAIESMLPQIQVRKETPAPIVEEETTEDDLKIQGLRETVVFYKDRLEEATKTNQRLAAQVKLLEAKLCGLQEALKVERRTEMREIRKERDLQVLQHGISVLRQELELARRQVSDIQNRQVAAKDEETIAKDLLPLKPVENFTRSGLEQAFSPHELKSGDIVLLLDSSGGGASTADELVKRGIRTVISRPNMASQALETLEKGGVTVVWAEDVVVEWINELPYLRKEELLRGINSAEKRKKLEAEEAFKQLLEEYKKERRLNGERA
ncbi:DUF460 domain-containing protein [Candidatus Bathyarchaeota archaeon]|nr:DUF460 domain-containing protein [Candidatus Bathyarchaeota archaeon]